MDLKSIYVNNDGFSKNPTLIKSMMRKRRKFFKFKKKKTVCLKLEYWLNFLICLKVQMIFFILLKIFRLARNVYKHCNYLARELSNCFLLRLAFYLQSDMIDEVILGVE